MEPRRDNPLITNGDSPIQGGGSVRPEQPGGAVTPAEGGVYRMNEAVAAMLANAERKADLFDWLCDMGAVRWLSGQIFLGGIESVMPRN